MKSCAENSQLVVRKQSSQSRKRFASTTYRVKIAKIGLVDPEIIVLRKII